MVGLLVNYLDIMGATRVAYFKADTEEKSQVNIDRYFDKQNVGESFVSSSPVQNGSAYDCIIMDEWTVDHGDTSPSCIMK